MLNISASSGRLAAVFFGYGLAFLLPPLLLGGGWWLLAWCTAAWWWVALGFLRRDPRHLGKRTDGTLQPLMAVLLLPYLLFVLGLFHAKRWLVRRENPSDRVAEGMYLGRRPLPGEIPEEVQLVVDLSAELPKPRGLGNRRYRCLPILNRFAPTAEALEPLIRDLAADPAPMLIHCIAGKGRSATVAAAVLIARGQATDAADAERQLQASRPGVHLHPSQKRVVDAVSGGSGGA
jgi:protein-tyrosine phosphatase